MISLRRLGLAVGVLAVVGTCMALGVQAFGGEESIDLARRIIVYS